MSFSRDKLFLNFFDMILFSLYICCWGSGLDPTVFPSPFCNQLPCFFILMKQLEFETGNPNAVTTLHLKIVGLIGKQMRFNTTGFLNRGIYEIMHTRLANIGYRMSIPKICNEFRIAPNFGIKFPTYRCCGTMNAYKRFAGRRGCRRANCRSHILAGPGHWGTTAKQYASENEGT